jgi:hypothetical protein
VFRYEVRRWRDGVIADAGEAVVSPQLLSNDPATARRLLDLVGCLPSPVWGRDELGRWAMWNSNSVIAWLLASSGLPADAICPPAGGRAPGWRAGAVTASTVDPRSRREPTGRGPLHTDLARRSGVSHCAFPLPSWLLQDGGCRRTPPAAAGRPPRGR